MASAHDRQKLLDDAAVEEIRLKFGDAEAAKLAADLYKLRRAPAAYLWGGLPRWAIVVAALWVAALETAEKLPELMLAFPRYEATRADYQAKMLQPDIASAQLTKAQNDAEASKLQPALTQAQLTTTEYEAKAATAKPGLATAQLQQAQNEAAASDVKPDLAQAQLRQTTNEAAASQVRPDLAAIELQKAKFDTLAAAFGPKTAETQLTKLGIDTKVAGITLPVTEQGVAMSGAMMTAMSPLTSALLGLTQPKAATSTGDPAPTAISTEPQSQDYLNGKAARDQWESYVGSLTGDAQEGAQFWASVRSENRSHTCREGKGGFSEEFRRACAEARAMLTPIDNSRHANADYLKGWNYR